MSSKKNTQNILEFRRPAGKTVFLPDNAISYPELYLDVHIVGNRGGFAQMFARAGCTMTPNPEDADLVVFTGGADVDPQLYGEKQHFRTTFDPGRDKRDMTMFNLCKDLGIPMLGICRGAQFLHVMNGGKLFQHVDRHTGDHSIVDLDDNNRIVHRVSSTHHQMCVKNNRMMLIAYATKSRNRWYNPDDADMGTTQDVEAYYYRETACLGIQGHPEFVGYPEFTLWSLNKISTYIQSNTADLHVVEGKLRLRDPGPKPEPEVIKANRKGRK